MSRFTKTSAALGAIVIATLGLSACSSGSEQSADATQGGDTAAEVLVVATSGAVKPYTFLAENDDLTGYDIEILKLVDERLDDIEFKFEVTEFPALFAGLDSGRFDIVANNLSATEERREKYDFSVPTIEAQFGIVTAADSDFGPITKIDDLAGLRTYGTPGLNYTKMLEQYNEDNPDKQVIIEYTELDLQLQYQNLAAGLVDFTFAERVVYKGYGSDAGLDLNFEPLDNDYLVDTYGTNLYSAYAFSKVKDHSAALAKIDAVLTELLADGTISALSEDFFDGLDVTPRSSSAS